MKTAYQTRIQLPKIIRKPLVDNLRNSKSLRMKCATVYDVIESFVWLKTSEGHVFWEYVAHFILTGKQLPQSSEKFDSDDYLKLMRNNL